jgi:hypothetical protein
MLIAPIFHKLFREIYAKPCWNVKPGYGSFFTLEFGRPHLDVREPTEASKNASEECEHFWPAGVFLSMASGI